MDLAHKGLSRREIGESLHRPERWVRRAFARYDPAIGLGSRHDGSSRPKQSPTRTPAEIERALCDLKQAHPVWGRRQIAKQLRWRWRDDPQRLAEVSVGRVRRVLAGQPELQPAHAPPADKPLRQMDYLTCNLLWAAAIQETQLPDGSTWRTLHWIDWHSRYLLGQLTVPSLSEALVVESFLAVACQPW